MSRLAYIALGACAATIIVLVAMSRKGAATAYEEPEDGGQPVDPRLLFKVTGTTCLRCGGFQFLNLPHYENGCPTTKPNPYPAGLVRHG